MENAAKLKMVAEYLHELKHFVQKLDDQKESVHQIELDLALEKVRGIYDILSKIHLTAPAVMPQEKVEKVTDQVIIKEEPMVVPEIKIEKEPVVVVPEPVAEAKIEAHEQKEPEPATSLIDLFSASTVQEKQAVKKTIVEKMAEEKPVEILAEKIGKKKITGLNQAIGINEKFFFINELFDGNMKTYKEAIDTLDRFDSLTNAAEYLEFLARDKSWDKSNEAYVSLMGFIERRFS